MNLAPIALFVYNRPQHTRQVVEALLQNELAGASDLFVYADGAKRPEHQEAVRAVRDYIRSVTGFRSVTLIERESNYGCAKSIVTGITETVNRFGRIIVVEDDVVTSPYFLRYMNEALDLYESEEKVACIHGYLYPVQVQLPETFFIKGADIWGWATWKRGWDLYQPDGSVLLRELKARGLTREFDFEGSFGFTKMLKDQIAGKIDTWDIQWYASSFLHDKLTLYPGRSLTRNIGYDSSGTHCRTGDLFNVEISQTPIELQKIMTAENAVARKAIGSFHRSTRSAPLKRIWNKIKGI